mgnify:CR=1 FL=1|tara:strand:- start:537 stop:746 length:210 start_codon:yes stop_codon:yes gene_type:complete
MKKLYYIYNSPHGCMGGNPKGHIDSEIFTSLAAASKELKQSPGSIRWVSWQWDDDNGRLEITKIKEKSC